MFITAGRREKREGVRVTDEVKISLCTRSWASAATEGAKRGGGGKTWQSVHSLYIDDNCSAEVCYTSQGGPEGGLAAVENVEEAVFVLVLVVHGAQHRRCGGEPLAGGGGVLGASKTLLQKIEMDCCASILMRFRMMCCSCTSLRSLGTRYLDGVRR